MTEVARSPVTRFIQDPKTYAWTFGGYDAARRIHPGDVLDVYAEDCFDGRVRSTADLPSKSIEYPFINPQARPFFVGGAEPDDTLAIHLIDVRPARDWAVSTGLSVSDAYQLISQIATSRIASVVDPNYTIVAKVPKRYLPRDVPWMGGIHDRLRAIGRALVATSGQ